jgi:hypothetical protein
MARKILINEALSKKAEGMAKNFRLKPKKRPTKIGRSSP